MLYVLRISLELLVFQKGTATATSELTLSQCLHVVYIIEHMAHRYLRALTEQFLQYSVGVVLAAALLYVHCMCFIG